MSSTERLTEGLAAFQLTTVQHTNYTEHTDCTGYTEKWLKVRDIGRGGFSLVRLEEESKTKELRAVKAVDIRKNCQINPLREIHALAKLKTAQSPSGAIEKGRKLLTFWQWGPYFVEFRGWWEEHDADRDIHRLHIAMDFLENGDLEAYLQHRCVEEKVGKTIMKQVFEGLEFLHAKGFTHRDIKPSVCEPIG
jgi:serine/threonine protein kinase